MRLSDLEPRKQTSVQTRSVSQSPSLPVPQSQCLPDLQPTTSRSDRLLARARPRWRYLLIGLGLIIALDNLHLFSQKKTQFIEAGHWVAQHIKTQERVYLNSPRTAYHAGWGYRRWLNLVDDRAALRAGLAAGDYDWLVLEFSRHEQAIPAQLEALGLETIEHFSIPKGDSVLVTRPLIKSPVKTLTEPPPP